MTVARISGDVRITGDLQVDGTMPTVERNDLAQDSNQVYQVPLTEFRVHDAVQTNLPGTAAADDLGLVTGTLGTDAPTIQTGDLKSAGATTRYARAQLALPPEYVDGESVTLRLSAGMKTTVADTSCTVDVEAYASDREGAVGSDLCSTAAQSINDDLVLENVDFTITPTGLSAGDLLDVRIAIACNDASTGTAVIGVIGAVELLLDVKG